MKSWNGVFSVLTVVVAGLVACAPVTRQIPTLRVTQYALQPESVQTQTKSNVAITAGVLRITDIYDHPDLFAFRQEEAGFPDNAYLKRNYPRDPGGRQWEYWFASPDASEQLLICWVSIKNGTDHILRMRDARIYLVADGRDPIPAIGAFDGLLSQADRYWSMTVRQAQESRGLIRLTPPEGFARAVLSGRREAFKLINDVSREILPGFTLEGMLAFPMIPTTFGSVTLSFFDITTKTDAAGNAVEKARFDFALRPQTLPMWYDATATRWRVGTPP